jgi:MFS family permease
MPNIRVVSYVFPVCLGGLSHGAMLSWPAEVLPQLTKPSSSLGWLDQNMITWIASINYIGCMAGSLLAAPLMKVASPRVLIGCSSLLASLSWLMVGLSNSPFTLCLSRVSLGCGNAILMASVPSYVATVAPVNCRGALSSCYGLALGLGLIYSVALGITISWSSLSLIASIPSLVLFISSPFLYNPLKSNTEDSESTMITSCQQIKPKVERPLLLFFYLAAMYMLSGVCPLGTFAEMLFTDESTFVASDLILASLACQIVGGLVGAAAIDRLGRKPVLQAGAWLCLLANILLSLYFSTVGDQHKCPTRPGSVLCWTPAVATCIFFFGFGGGLGNVFFVLLGEVCLTIY